jgi:isocitrate/isopropylmalate dehydrogenase
MMLEYAGQRAASEAIEKAVRASVANMETTRDLGGRLSTTETGLAIAGRIGCS